MNYITLKKKISMLSNNPHAVEYSNDFMAFSNSAEHAALCNKFYDAISEYYRERHFSICCEISDKIFLKDEKISLLSIFILKSCSKVKITPSIYDINYVLHDAALNDIALYCRKLIIFFTNKECADPVKLKRECFGVLEILCEIGVIKTQSILSSGKTIKHVGTGLKNLTPSILEYLHISYQEYVIIKTPITSYLRGWFFTNVYKIYIENIRSNERFVLKDDEYLIKMCKKQTFVLKSDLSRIIDSIEMVEKIKLSSIPLIIDNVNANISANLSKIKVNMDIAKNISSCMINEAITSNFGSVAKLKKHGCFESIIAAIMLQ